MSAERNKSSSLDVGLTSNERLPKVFLGVHEVAGYYTRLAEGFAAIDVPVTRVLINDHPFAYSQSNRLEHFCRWVSRWRRLKWMKGVQSFALRVIESSLLRWAAASHDVFIIGFGRSLDGCMSRKYRFRDLAYLRKRNKIIICVFHGSDVRPAWLNGASVGMAPRELNKKVQRQRNMVAAVEASATHIISHPPMAILQRRPYLHYLMMGIPLTSEAGQQTISPVPVSENDRDRPPVILHAPSSSRLKGSADIEAALDALRLKGHEFEYVRIENMAHSAVQKELLRADFVIDQVYSDTPMAHFAAEAAFHGVPAVVCGLDLPKLKQSFLPPYWPPSETGTPDCLQDLIEKMLRDPEHRRRLGNEARTFVSENWTAEMVARRFLRLISDDIPDDWVAKPIEPSAFFGGWGMNEITRANLAGDYLRDFGFEAAGISDLPWLEQAFDGLAVAEAINKTKCK